MRGAVGFGIVARMETENEETRRSRRRFSAEEKARMVELYKESGLTGVAFCRREGVSLFNLQRWLMAARMASSHL
jgi:transposase-like protein